MLKEFEIIYTDKYSYQHDEHVIAFDEYQARHAFIYAHPDADATNLSCIEL